MEATSQLLRLIFRSRKFGWKVRKDDKDSVLHHYQVQGAVAGQHSSPEWRLANNNKKYLMHKNWSQFYSLNNTSYKQINPLPLSLCLFIGDWLGLERLPPEGRPPGGVFTSRWSAPPLALGSGLPPPPPLPPAPTPPGIPAGIPACGLG